MEVHNGAGGFNVVAHLGGAGGESLEKEFFVFLDKVSDLAVLCGDAVEGFNIEFAEAFDVDGAAILNGGDDDWV